MHEAVAYAIEAQALEAQDRMDGLQGLIMLVGSIGAKEGDEDSPIASGMAKLFQLSMGRAGMEMDAGPDGKSGS